MIRSVWGVEGGEGDGGGGGGAGGGRGGGGRAGGGRMWSNVVRNGEETAEEKRQRAEKLKKAFQVKLQLEGKKMFTVMKDRVNDADPVLITQAEIGRLLVKANVEKDEVIGIKHNEFRKGQVEILLKDDAKVDSNTLKGVIEKEDMKMSVGSFGQIDEVFMIYGLPLTTDVEGLKVKIKEAIVPFVKRVISIEASKHYDEKTEEIFKGKLNGN